MIIATILVGLALLFFGRQLFWLFVGGAGFVAGMVFATDLLQRQASDWTTLAIAIIAGVIGAVLGILLQRFAIALAGFIAGAYVGLSLAVNLGDQNWAWIAAIIGGVIGAVLVAVLFDWALILLSALTGSILVASNLRLEPWLSLVIFAVLLLAGITAQSASLRHRAMASKTVDEGG